VDFRVEGSLSIREKSLGWEVQLGPAREYLEWLPRAEEAFPKQKAGYLWTTVHFSGTIDKPEQDLSPRIIDALRNRPADFSA
jgi:hypothetical protein